MSKNGWPTPTVCEGIAPIVGAIANALTETAIAATAVYRNNPMISEFRRKERRIEGQALPGGDRRYFS